MADPDPDSEKKADPDPGEQNPDPKHWMIKDKKNILNVMFKSYYYRVSVFFRPNNTNELSQRKNYRQNVSEKCELGT